MEQNQSKWSKTVFRLRGLPNTTETPNEVASLLSSMLVDTPADSIRIFSLATTLSLHENPRSKVATIMFTTAPAIVTRGHDEDQWVIRSDNHVQHDLILDAHFMGMTPLNDVPSMRHSYDCIALSGLASHPFGSWQPKGDDKTFMWIRDNLPKHLHCVRCIIYGYSTKLHDSQSFQSIQDLAHKLIDQLLAYGWGAPSGKPIAFLAHSLGGLVFKDALVQLHNGQDQAYKTLLGLIQGSIFFGVPNLGMEQAHFRTIVQSNPNEALVDDIARNSNYLRRLNEAFTQADFDTKLRCFWAFETSESPTVSRTEDGKINQNGPGAILVSRESATCRFIDRNRPVTFPIDETHSNMVKFKEDSQYYNVVLDKLSRILQISRGVKHSLNDGSTMNSQPYLVVEEHDKTPSEQASSPKGAANMISFSGLFGTNLSAKLDSFKRMSSLTSIEEAEFMNASYNTIQLCMRELQTEQEKQKRLMYMKRLEPFLISVQQFEQIVEVLGVFVSVTDVMAYVWGPMEYILRVAFTFPDAFNSILDAYQIIGEQIPLVRDLRPLFISQPHLKEALVMIYNDILEFHQRIMQQFKNQLWKQLFTASWRDLAASIDQIKESIARNKRLIENQVSIVDFEAIRTDSALAEQKFQRQKAAQDGDRRAMVAQWLSPFNADTEQDRHRKARSICKDPGRWLFNNAQFQQWFEIKGRLTPFLWLSGIPGAGKTILASVVVDAARDLPGATVAFFYCKHGEEAQNSFISVARSILAQILVQNPHLLPHFHEKASMSSDAILTSPSVAKEMLQIALGSCEELYLVLDGLDECNPKERKEISNWFQAAVENLTTTETNSARCLFISQCDEVALQDFRDIPSIKITDENRDDLTDFATVWHRRIEGKFGALRSNNCHIAHIISARSQGMFIFAELFAKYLEDQLSRADVLAELDPAKLPVKLDHVYERILDRIFDSRADNIVKYVEQILGWIVCARRPLRWREIQAVVSIDLENQRIDYDKEIADTPKGLFASLVELQEDGTIELVHGTAREYLLRKKAVDLCDADYSLSIMSLGYLSLPQMEIERSEEDIRSDLVKGVYAFYDYASACWAMHLPNGVSELKAGDKLTNLQETLETFIESHWSSTHKPLQDTKRIQKMLVSMESSDQFNQIIQAVAWTQKQSGRYGQGPKPDDALNLWQLTERIRSVLEDMLGPSLLETDAQRLHHFYGENWFKCPRVNCHYYHHGFNTAKEREKHISKHERPFLCIVSGCPMNVFGCVTQNKLQKHLFETHAIDMFDDTEEAGYPEPIKAKTPHNTAQRATTFECHLCDKKFTRKHNLLNHTRVHEGSKPFACSICDRLFTRKADCDRHERGHGDKKFKCFGPLKDGTSWGCNAAFGRADKLADHLRSKTGRKCLRPVMIEKLQESSSAGVNGNDNMFANQIGENADALLAAGRSLPSFQEFLQLCDLNGGVTSPGSETASSPNNKLSFKPPGE